MRDPLWPPIIYKLLKIEYIYGRAGIARLCCLMFEKGALFHYRTAKTDSCFRFLLKAYLLLIVPGLERRWGTVQKHHHPLRVPGSRLFRVLRLLYGVNKANEIVGGPGDFLLI